LAGKLSEIGYVLLFFFYLDEGEHCHLLDGIAVGGFIHKPFSNETIWSFGDRKNTPMTFLIIMDEIRYTVKKGS
jgi:hypothetical protein